MSGMSLEPGTVFAGYVVERLLGVGGMGSVYLARHPNLPRRDALKLLRAELCADPVFAARFHREADTVARLNHPHILPVHDRGSQDGQLWISMPYVEGRDAKAGVGATRRGCRPSSRSTSSDRSGLRWTTRTGSNCCTVMSSRPTLC